MAATAIITSETHRSENALFKEILAFLKLGKIMTKEIAPNV